MSKEAEEAFEIGKQLLENNNASEAISALAKAVRLDSTNAEYRAWLAQAWNGEKKYSEATLEANQAIALNPNCIKAYRQLGYAQLYEQKYTESLNSFSKAIEIEPNSPDAYNGRSQVYFALKNYENALIERAQYFQLASYDSKPTGYSGLGSKFESWYQIIDKHLTNIVWSQLEANNERYVMYYPCYLTWDKKLQVTQFRSQNYLYHGTGYICLTNKKIRLFSLAQISRQFSMYREGLILSILGTNDSKRENTDKSWDIPYNTVTGVQIADNAIRLVTTAMTWEICEHITDSLTEIFAGINAGLSGKFLKKPSMPEPQTNENIIILLKQLGELKTQGIISDVDYEQKKKELLARL